MEIGSEKAKSSGFHPQALDESPDFWPLGILFYPAVIADKIKIPRIAAAGREQDQHTSNEMKNGRGPRPFFLYQLTHFFT